MVVISTASGSSYSWWIERFKILHHSYSNVDFHSYKISVWLITYLQLHNYDFSWIIELFRKYHTNQRLVKIMLSQFQSNLFLKYPDTFIKKSDFKYSYCSTIIFLEMTSLFIIYTSGWTKAPEKEIRLENSSALLPACIHTDCPWERCRERVTLSQL